VDGLSERNESLAYDKGKHDEQAHPT
jgi:hypothetical protein